MVPTASEDSFTPLSRDRDAGQALVVVALLMVVLIGFMGLGIDLGYLRYMKRRLQQAADAAAIAGAQELSQCGSTPSCTALRAAAQSAMTENGFTGSTLVAGCGSSSDSLILTVNNPPCSVSTDPHKSDNHYVEVLVSQVQPLFFSSIFGSRTVKLTARSEAGLGSGASCIFALDPSGSNAISVDFLASVNSACGVVDESSSSSGLSCFLGALRATSIQVVGNTSSFLCTLSPSPRTHVLTPAPADPLAYLTAPSVGSCGVSSSSPYMGYNGSSSGLSISGTATLNPGVYCGGIRLNAGANVTLNPGTYILTSPSSTSATGYGLTVDIGARVSGSGVMFYNTVRSGAGSPGPIQFVFTSFGGSGVSLTAPTSGTYQGILFWQDAANTSQAQILGSSSFNTTLQGSFYFPKAKVVFAFDGPIQYDILDAWQIEFAALTFASSTFSTSTFTSDYSSLANGSPVKGTGGILVE